MKKPASDHVRSALRQAMARADDYRCVAIILIPNDADTDDTNLIVGGASNTLEIMGAIAFAEQKVAETTARMRVKAAEKALHVVKPPQADPADTPAPPQ